MFKNVINFQLNRMFQKANFAVSSIVLFLFFSTQITAQSKVIDVDTFNKIIVSPGIEVVFKEGTKESVSIESITVPMEKLNVIVENNALNIYLEGARITANKKQNYNNKTKFKTAVYKGTVVRAVVTYKKINALDLRGNEKFIFESKISTDKLNLKIYGESQVYINNIDILNLHTSIYGESYLEIQEGQITQQKFTAYGESKVNALNVESNETTLTAYGDGTFQFNVSEKLKITSYGEAVINYSGSAQVQKGLIIGNTKITNVNF